MILSTKTSKKCNGLTITLEDEPVTEGKHKALHHGFWIIRGKPDQKSLKEDKDQAMKVAQAHMKKLRKTIIAMFTDEFERGIDLEWSTQHNCWEMHMSATGMPEEGTRQILAWHQRRQSDVVEIFGDAHEAVEAGREQDIISEIKETRRNHLPEVIEGETSPEEALPPRRPPVESLTPPPKNPTAPAEKKAYNFKTITSIPLTTRSGREFTVELGEKNGQSSVRVRDKKPPSPEVRAYMHGLYGFLRSRMGSTRLYVYNRDVQAWHINTDTDLPGTRARIEWELPQHLAAYNETYLREQQKPARSAGSGIGV